MLSKEVLLNILDSIADGVFTVDLDWNITFLNRSGAKILKVEPEEAVGKKCWDVFKSSICDGECALRSCLDYDMSITNRKIYIVNSEGEKVPISISASPLYDTEGKIIGGVETFRDITYLDTFRKEVEKKYTFEDIVSKNQNINRIFKILPQIAQSDSTVLLTGESGTGKELFARAIHNLSARRDKEFVIINCGALPETLLESELFGYRAGAFTDAKRDKAGKILLADGGTVFFDEIGDMPISIQTKLLRFMQEKTIEPLGSTKTLFVDARIIAATNKDLEKLVGEGKFREDLYYRLNVVHLKLPPLRERKEDIPLLVDHFIKKFNILKNKEILSMSDEALSILMKYDFPGNIRELKNILEYAFILCNHSVIQKEHLPEHFHSLDSPVPVRPMSMEEIKCHAVLEALKRNKGKKMAACRELKISKDTLRRILKKCKDMA